MMMKLVFAKSIVVLSGLLCCASFIAWFRSHRVSDLVVWGSSGGNYYEIVTIPGQFRLTRVSNWSGDPPALRWWSSEQVPPTWPVFGQQPVRAAWLPAGIGLEHGSRRINNPIAGPQAYAPMTVAYQIVAVPFAVPAFLAGMIALLPLVRRIHLRRLHEERTTHGLCPACGYDLRATPGRCPECGHATSPVVNGPPT